MPSRNKTAKPNPVVEQTLALLAPVGEARARPMFGGHGIYLDDLCMALIGFDRLYFKVDDETRAAFEAAGAERFTWTRPDGTVMGMSYYRLPDEADPAETAHWAGLALDAARRARTRGKRPADARRKVPV